MDPFEQVRLEQEHIDKLPEKNQAGGKYMFRCKLEHVHFVRGMWNFGLGAVTVVGTWRCEPQPFRRLYDSKHLLHANQSPQLSCSRKMQARLQPEECERNPDTGMAF
jgi:hypothetical protein